MSSESMLEEIKREIVSLKTELLLTRFAVEETEKKVNLILEKMEQDELNRTMGGQSPNVHVEKF